MSHFHMRALPAFTCCLNLRICFHPRCKTLCLIMSSVSRWPCHPDHSLLLICLHSSQLLRLCCISKHHHPLGRDTLLFPVWNVRPHHSFRTQVWWGSTVLVNARCINNRDKVPFVCSICIIPVSWGLDQPTGERPLWSCGPVIEEELPFFMCTVLPQNTLTALWRQHSLVSREQFYIKCGSKDPFQSLGSEDFKKWNFSPLRR